MWEIGLKSQLVSFAAAIAMGMMLSCVFDILRAFRKVLKHSAAVVFVQDLLFFALAAFSTFLLLVARCNGEVRAYMLFGVAVGFFLYRFTVSRFFLFGLTVKFFSLIAAGCRYISGLTDKFGGFLEVKLTVLIKNVKKIFKNINFNRKNS